MRKSLAVLSSGHAFPLISRVSWLEMAALPVVHKERQ